MTKFNGFRRGEKEREREGGKKDFAVHAYDEDDF